MFYNDQSLRSYLIILKPYEYLYACYKILLKWVSNPSFDFLCVTYDAWDTLLQDKNAAATTDKLIVQDIRSIYLFMKVS